MEKSVLELFAGVGGFHLGLSKSNKGWKVVAANQWEPNKKVQHAYNCYVSHFPEVKVYNEDIAEVISKPDKYPIPNYNLLVGGFPCQDYSVAATGAKGIEGKKGVLWWEIRKVLLAHQPPFMLLENVDRLLKSPKKQRGRDFAVMLACLRDLGYNVEWRVINAAEYGFSQRRRRVFIFAYHSNTEYYRRQNEKLKQSGTNKHIKENGFFVEEFPIQEVIDRKQYTINEDILTISNEKHYDFYNSGIMIGENVITEKYVPVYIKPKTLGEELETNVPEKYYLGDKLEKWEYMKGAKSEPRKTKDGFEYMFTEGPIAFPDPIDRPARTMLTSETSKNRSTHVVEDTETNRKRLITPVEAERLNGFDDNWTSINNMPEKFRYFCMGNALVVGLVEKMGRTISDIFEQEN